MIRFTSLLHLLISADNGYLTNKFVFGKAVMSGTRDTQGKALQFLINFNFIAAWTHDEQLLATSF